MIATRDGEVVAVHRATNKLKSPLKYQIDPIEQLRIHNAIEDAGLDLGIIYHSHTRSDPVPSQTDINLAQTFDGKPQFPGTLYLIVGVKGLEPDLRLWSIVGNDYELVELKVTE